MSTLESVNEEQRVTIDMIPLPVLFEEIFTEFHALPPISFPCIFRVCKKWSKCASNSFFWEKLVKNKIEYLSKRIKYHEERRKKGLPVDLEEELQIFTPVLHNSVVNYQKPEGKDWKWVFLSKFPTPNPMGVYTGIGCWQNNIKGVRYEGEWQKGIKHGFGIKYYRNGSIYIGEYSHSKRTGNGTYISKSGCYKGGFIEGKKHGTGVLTLKSGGKYSGSFGFDFQNGQGSFHWSNGDIFHGNWLNGKRSGKGVYVWADGDRYEGDFLDNKRTGKGKFIYASGSWYEGDYVEGTRNGYGVYHWANGNQYIGEFKAGACEGKGIFIQTDGWVIGNTWVDDKPVNATYSPEITEAIQNGSCTFTTTGKNRYGQLFYQTREMDDRPHGVCVVCVKTCVPRNGMFVEGVSKFGGNFYCDCGSGYDPRYKCYAAASEELHLKFKLKKRTDEEEEEEERNCVVEKQEVKEENKK
eukprot:TRINITY_DN2659_c0_g1_i1.p1 TRINITY_DN2659_c0_g1~~TRINITY_DN2659_c0_g1_i1.p1  ORF type:complete len:545 (+),score=97.83 TRINITY_DN2659_c0_g1_i1:237-1637(+)